MGIQGLLIGLKPFTRNGNIQEFRGESIAIDTSSWLHKSVYSIADHYVECIENNNLDRRCVNTSAKYITKRCQELLFSAGIHRIYLVMDGKRCPLKAGTNQERDARRQKNLQDARNYRRQKRHDAMYEKYRSCIKVTEELATKVVRIVQERLADQVEIVWSPYEADAQLAQMCVDGRAAAVITEDSDVLVYSASCQSPFPIIFKLDRKTGKCDVLSLDWLLNEELPKRAKDHEVTQLEVVLGILRSRQLAKPGWGSRLFVQACVLAGCDYAPRKVSGVGLVNAFKMVRNVGCTGSMTNLARVFRQVLCSEISTKSRGSLGNVTDFEELLAQSEAVFYYHPVCLLDGTVVHFNSPSSDPAAVSPALDRFSDRSFVGLLVANHNENAIIPETLLRSQKSKPPKTNSPTVAQQKAKQHKSVQKVQNPYAKPQPENQTPNIQNMFAAYSNRHQDPEARLRSFKIVTAKLPVKSKKDIRFPKRSFPKDGAPDREALSKRAEKLQNLRDEDLFPPQKLSRTTDRSFSDAKQRHRRPWGETGISNQTSASVPLSSEHAPAEQPRPLHELEGRQDFVDISDENSISVVGGEKSPFWNEESRSPVAKKKAPSEPSVAMFSYSPNLLEEKRSAIDGELSSISSLSAPDNQGDLTGTHGNRRITVGATPRFGRPAVLIGRFDENLVERTTSPVIDLSEDDLKDSVGDVEAPTTRNQGPPKVLSFRIGGTPAKLQPKRRGLVAKYVLRRRKVRHQKAISSSASGKPKQRKLSQWFAPSRKA